MTNALASRTLRERIAAARAIRVFPNAAFALVTAVVLACGAAIANMHSSWARAADTASIDAGAPAETPAATAKPGAGAAADSVWGVVESITALTPVADRPDEFDFTVRLRDRSARLTRRVGRARWRVGDRIMQMGGSAPPTD